MNFFDGRTVYISQLVTAVFVLAGGLVVSPQTEIQVWMPAGVLKKVSINEHLQLKI
jgi:hypothetical protein